MELKKILISICIPAYKRPQNLVRLLQSIRIQEFDNYEVIISDDSPDDDVSNVVAGFIDLPVRYFKNEKPLGTPSNWNYAISKAEGEWVKIMHDDDWFMDKSSLQKFADATGTGSRFIFSAYHDVFESGAIKRQALPWFWRKRIIDSPVSLLARNVIGPPSVTLIHSEIKEQYDTFLKWRVDIDFYIRVLGKYKSYHSIETALVNVGISNTQVTHDCINIPEVELPEGLILLKKYGTGPLRNILVYDAWWRILRNVGVRSIRGLEHYTPYDDWPESIKKMVKHQTLIPLEALKVGVISKVCMLLSFLINMLFIKNKKLKK